MITRGSVLRHIPSVDHRGLLLAPGNARPKAPSAGRSKGRASLWERVVAPAMRVTVGVVVLGAVLALGYVAQDEIRHATLQSRWLAAFGWRRRALPSSARPCPRAA